MEALGATAEAALSGEATVVAARVASICDKIKEHRDAGKPMSARRAAAISAMIDSIAAAEEVPTTTRKKARKGGARWNEELARLDERKPGVVVKSLRHGCSGGGDGNVGDILREACFMAACRGHPSLAGYIGVTRTPAGTDGDEYALVVDSVGPSLADVLRDSGRRPFPEPVVRRVMRQLLGGAKAMAERGVVHRDINPANIQFAGGRGGAVRIASGFGAAKHAGEKDPPRRFAGTNGYVAPEVLLGNAGHGAPADAWSLGCVMAELLTGRPPPFFAAGEEEGEDKKNDEQLRKIFEVLGVPGRKAWQALKPAAGEAQRQRRSRLNGQDCSLLREMVPGQVLSDEGFEVLSGLLTCDPKKRLTAAAALRCPWFADNADDVAVVLSTAVSKIADAATTSWSLVCQMAVSLAGRTLGLLRLA